MKGIPVKLSYLLNIYLQQLHAKIQDRNSLLAYNEVVTRLRTQLRHLSLLTPGAGRARAVHKMLDEVHRKCEKHDPEWAATITCRKGCSHCCHMFVTCTEDEAALLEELVKERGLTLDTARLEKQKDWMTDDYWKQTKETARCVFLGDDDLCTVYEDRPSACRNFTVSTPPKNCEFKFDGTEPPKNTIAGVLRPEAEILASAAMTLDEEAQEEKTGLAYKMWKRFGGKDGSGSVPSGV